MKYISIIILAIVSLTCQAQVNGNFKQVRLLNNTDSTSLGNTTGIFRYDPVTGKYRFFNALTQTWFSFSREGTGNFWPLSGTGTVTGDVTISSNADAYQFISILRRNSANTQRSSIGLNGEDSNFTSVNVSSLYDSKGAFIETGATSTTGSANFKIVTTGALESSIFFSNTSMLVTDQINSKGLVYAANYASNYTARSLVDKAYVDGLIPSLTATYVGYGSGGNALTGESAFTYNATSNTLTLDNISISGSATIALPTNNNSATQILVRNSVGGAVQYRDASSIGASAAGSNSQIQFNNAGAFGADPDLTFVTGTNTLVAGNVTVNSTVLTATAQVTSLSSGRVTYATTGGVLADEGDFTYDAGSNQLRVLSGAMESTFSATGVQATDADGFGRMNAEVLNLESTTTSNYLILIGSQQVIRGGSGSDDFLINHNNTTGVPGEFLISGSATTSTAGGVSGGDVTIRTGFGGGTNSPGGTLTLEGGGSSGTGHGGDIVLYPGDASGVLGSQQNGRIYIREQTGTHCTMGIATLSAGNVNVANNLVTANTRIFLTAQGLTATPGEIYVASRVVGTSFQISSTSATDDRQVVYLLFEPIN